MSRLLAQPIYRDALLLGKFLAGLAAIAVALVTLWLLVIGLGLVTLGVPPTGEEVLRGLAFLVVAIAYGGVWLAVAMLCSVMFRSAATSALAALGLWLLVSVLWPLVVQFVTTEIFPPTQPISSSARAYDQLELQQTLSRLSPSTLFGEAMLGILHPTTRALGLVFLSQLEGAVMGTPLPLGRACCWSGRKSPASSPARSSSSSSPTSCSSARKCGRSARRRCAQIAAIDEPLGLRQRGFQRAAPRP